LAHRKDQGKIMAQPKDSKRTQSPVAANYIIEIKNGRSRSFVICHPTLIIEDGENWGGMTAQDLSRYIEECNLSAAPLPGRPLRTEEFRSGPGHQPGG
jgi:hypothetical protein